jgi:TPR repeat protein
MKLKFFVVLIAIMATLDWQACAQTRMVQGKIYNWNDHAWTVFNCNMTVKMRIGNVLICQPYIEKTVHYGVTKADADRNSKVVRQDYGSLIGLINYGDTYVGADIYGPVNAIRIADTNSSYDVKVDNQVITSGDSIYRKTVSYTLYDVGVPYTRPMTPEEKNASEKRSFIANSNAVMWLQSEATNGSVSAQCSLGLHYLNGQGCETNKELAVYWLTQAANQGEIEASNKLEWIRSQKN